MYIRVSIYVKCNANIYISVYKYKGCPKTGADSLRMDL